MRPEKEEMIPKQEDITKPLKVAICVTKNGPDADACYTGLFNGILNHGDFPRICHHIDDIKSFQPDVLIMVGYAYFDPREKRLNHGWPEWEITSFKWSQTNAYRIDILNWCHENNRRILIIDSPALKGSRKRDGNPDAYYMLTYDMPKALGDYYPPSFPSPDRFNKLNLEIKPWTDINTNTYLILGQLVGGTATGGIDIRKFYKYVLIHLKASRKNACFLEHPNQTPEYTNTKYKIKYIRDRNTKFDGIQCSIGFNSNAIIESLLEGIPCLVFSRMSHAYPYCSNTLAEIDCEKKFDREGFFWQLAHSQYSIIEMNDGTMWNRYRPYALFDYKGI